MSDTEFRAKVVEALVQSIASYNEKLYYEDQEFRDAMNRDNDDTIASLTKSLPDEMPDKDAHIAKMKANVEQMLQNPDELRNAFVQIAKMEFNPEIILENVNQMFSFIPSFLMPKPVKILIEKFNAFFKQICEYRKQKQKPIIDILVKNAEENGIEVITLEAHYGAIRQIHPTADAFRTSINFDVIALEQQIMDFEKEMYNSVVADDETAQEMLKQLSNTLYDMVYSKKHSREFQIEKKTKEVYGEDS